MRKLDIQGYNPAYCDGHLAYRIGPHFASQLVLDDETLPPFFEDWDSYEDPRFFKFHGDLCMAFIVARRVGFPRFQVGHYNLTTRAATLHVTRENEKNWLFFEHEGRLCWTHTMMGEHVVRNDVGQEWRTLLPMRWTHGYMRGGAGYAMCDGLMWSFFHSTRICSSGRREYAMGCAAFERNAPFRIKAWTPKPLYVAPKNRTTKLSVIFPGSAHRDGDNWIITAGCDDTHCVALTIDHETLRRIMTWA